MSDSLVARASRTLDGATLFAKNSDRRGRESQPFVQLPAAFHPRGSRLRCTHLEIDQVAETYRVMGHSPVWCWGFEQGVNEFGVAIGNQATWSCEPLEQQAGLLGSDLVRLGLERGRDAREALEVIATLIESHGQGGSAFAAEGDGGCQNSFAIADGRSAWVLETTARRWAARSVEGARLTNALTLGDDWEIASRDLERHAAQDGHWSGSGRLDFRAAYGRRDELAFLIERRVEAGERLLAGPPITVESLKAWLRDHGHRPGPPPTSLDPSDPDRYSICMHADPVSTTTASLVARLPEASCGDPWPVWISFATPCTGIFMPVYLEGVLPPALAVSDGDPGSGASPKATPGATSSPRSRSIWESMRALQEQAAIDYGRSLPILREEWAKLVSRIEADRIETEAEAIALGEVDRRDARADVLTGFMARTTDRVIEESTRLVVVVGRIGAGR